MIGDIMSYAIIRSIIIFQILEDILEIVLKLFGQISYGLKYAC